MDAQHPCIGLFPALRLAKTLELGEWLIGTPPADTPWHSARFRDLVELLRSSWERDDPDLHGSAMLWHRDRGFDGTSPSIEQIAAIRAAVTFAVLDANDQVFRDPNAGRYLATAENAALYVQPIEEEEGLITHLRDGALKRVLTGGWKIGERPIPLPDAVVPLSRPVPASTKLARSVFELHMTPAGLAGQRACIAVEWHRVAMANPQAVTLQQRLIALKTGFEALFGTSNSWECAEALRRLFETATAPHLNVLPWAGILWSPKERTDLQRQYRSNKGKLTIDTRSELEDWFMTLAEARNTIIHEGRVAVTDYGPPPERPLSRYAGQLFWIGERVLREAVKARLGPDTLLCGLLAERAAWEPLYQHLKSLVERSRPSNTDEDEDSPTEREERGSTRTLDALLQALRCDAANKVQLRVATGGASASLHAASAMAGAFESAWVADSGNCSVLINAAERDLLENAGAEEALPACFRPCE